VNQVEYIVTQKDGAWTIRFSGRHFDRFETEKQALEKAFEWARNARRQGHSVPVLLEREAGRAEPVEMRTD
jgi:hypothetical protein